MDSSEEPLVPLAQEIWLLDAVIREDERKLREAQRDLEAMARRYGSRLALAAIGQRIEWHKRRLAIGRALRDTLRSPTPEQSLRWARRACEKARGELGPLAAPTYGAALAREREIEMMDYEIRAIDAILGAVQF